MASPNHVTSTVPGADRIITTNEKVTGVAGLEMLVRSGIKDSSSSLVVLDNACGGGIVTAKLLQLAKQQENAMKLERIIASDIDEKMLAYARKQKTNSNNKNNWNNVEIINQNQTKLSQPDNTFSHIFNNFGIFFCADDVPALSETFRTLKTGGVAGFTSWKSISWWLSLVEPALEKSMPDAPQLPKPGTLFANKGWSEPEMIRERLEKVGFINVESTEYRYTPDVEPAAFAEACGFLVKTIASKVWPQEIQEKYLDKIETALLEYLQQNYPNGKWNDHMKALITIAKKA